MVVNGKVNERAGSLQGQRMRVRVRQHVVGRLSVAVHIQCVPAVCHRCCFLLLVLLSRCSSPPVGCDQDWKGAVWSLDNVAPPPRESPRARAQSFGQQAPG